MSTGIKCPHCKRRNITSDSSCLYCGKPLDVKGPSTGAPSAPGGSPSTPPPPISPTPFRPSGSSPGSKGSAHSAYPMPTGSTAPMPAGPGSPTPAAPAPPLRPANWTYDLPAHLKKIGPAGLEGSVLSINELQVSAPVNLLQAVLKMTMALILLPFRPLIVLSALIFGQRSQREKETVYTIRIEQPDGRGAETRVEGEVTTSLAIRGDYISIWGKDRGGVLLAKKIFNHTSGVETILRR